MKRGIVAIAVLVLVFGTVPMVSAQRPLTIRLGVHGAVQGAPDVIAIRQGYFKQERLEVDWRRFGVGREGRDAMIAGAIDINATATTPFLIGLEKGVPYTAVAVNSYFCGTNHIVVRKDSDIKNIAQLKGKRIALARGTVTEYIFAAKIAPAYGLKPGDYEVANVADQKDRIPTLIAKAVDATGIGDPYVAIAEHEGLVQSLGDFCKYDTLPFLATVTNKVIKESPAAVVAYLRGWLRAVKLLREQPEKAAEVYWQEQDAAGRSVPVSVLDKTLRRMRWEPDITPEIEKYLADQAQDLLKGAGEGRLNSIPDINKALNKDLLRKAKVGL
jgi:ABC-type nitrate/sulfonate/bicarbonate transport system substrate-binding protein